MALHIHRNSFNAGEISPLMDARVDDAKHSFSCRTLENFIPKVYGGAFRRPGSVYVGTARDMAVWTENTNDHRLYFENADAPGVNDDESLYQVGSLWSRNVRTVYGAIDVTEGAAAWISNPNTHNLYSFENPTADNDTGEGYDVGSIWFNQAADVIYQCTDNTASAAVWELYTELSDATIGGATTIPSTKVNLTATAIPGVDNDTTEGYNTSSIWIVNTRTLYECTDATNGAAVWDTVSGTHNYVSDGAPSGANNDDEGYAVGSHWLWKDTFRAWELTSLDGSEPVRLIDFNVSANTRYVIEMGDGYARFWNADGSRFLDQLNSPYTDPLQVSTPYSASEAVEVQVAQLGNLAYFAHPSHPPQKLERTFDASFAAATFTWSELVPSYPVFRDINLSEVTATANGTVGKPVEISFSANPFTETTNYGQYAGARIALTHRRSAAHAKVDLTADDQSSEVEVLGDYEVYTYGVFTGALNIQFKDTAGAWQNLKTFQFTSESSRQIVYRSSTENPLTLRLDVEHTSGGGGTAYIEAGDSRRTGYARILSGIPFENSLPVVPVEVERDFEATTATTEWAIESWGEYAGYPRSVCFHEERLWFGGTELEPNTVWASATNDFENFRRGAFDGDSIAFTLAAQESSAIQSLLSHQALVIFTQSEEWTVSTSEQTSITPSNLFVRRQSRFGSAYSPAFVASNNLIFLEAGARKLRQFSYSASEAAQGVATDLSKYAEHITAGGIKQMAFQRSPDPVLWAVTNNGVLLSFTFEPDENVMGWARHTSGDDLFESVATIYGTSVDEVWLSVNRGGTRLVERLNPSAYSTLESGSAADMIYLDSSVFVENDPATDTVTGLDHLEGETVSILADGAVQADRAVSSGSITLDGDADTVVVGLSYTSTLQPSKIEVPSDNGTSQGKTFLCKKVHLNLWKTYGIEVSDGNDPSSWFPVLGRNPATPLGDPEPLFTGLAEVTNMGRHKESVDVTVRQTLPLPCNVLATIPQIQISTN